MKSIFTLIAFFFIVKANAAEIAIDSVPAKASQAPVRFICRAQATNPSNEPLVVIDGIVAEFNQLEKLNPCDIVSIDILKGAATTAIYETHAGEGVIIITTKAASERKLIVKDFLTGNTIPSATVYFISQSDTIKRITNENGVLVIDKLKPGAEYNMIVSSAGYKTFSAITANNKEQLVLLQKDVIECDGVVIKSDKWGRCTGCDRISYPIGKTAAFKFNSEVPAIRTVYPNPVQRGNAFNLELENEQDKLMQLSITSLNGNIVLQKPLMINKGINHISVTTDARWAAGIYIIQLRNEKGTVIKQEKLVVQ